MKILLINPPIRMGGTATLFPLGLGYIAAVLLEAGHSVEVLDINALEMPKGEVVKKIKETDSNVVGIGALSTSYMYVKWLTETIKEARPDLKVVIGGCVGSPIPGMILNKTKADVAVIGEGEKIIVDLVDAYENSKNLKSVKGIWYKEDGKIVQNPAGETINNLDEIPYPAWDLFPMEPYLKTPSFGSANVNKMTILTTRGCPFRCNFCYDNFGKITRYRSVDNIIGEVEELIKKYGVKYLVIVDETFVLKKDLVMEFCKRIKPFNIKWGGNGRVNTVDEEILKAMKESGCEYLHYGYESGSQKILDVIGKGATIEQAEKATAMTRKYGIVVTPALMFGMIGETEETIKETIDFCKRNNLYADFCYATPLPGTRLYEQAKQMGRIKNEEAYVERLGMVGEVPEYEFTQSFIVNLTDFSDEELVRLKNQTEKILRPNVFKKFFDYWKYYGFGITFNFAISNIKSHLSKRKTMEVLAGAE